MPDSDITVAALAITPGLGQHLAKWTFTDPNATAWDYLKLDAVELHSATSNDRSLATKVAEGITSAVNGGLPETAVRYYWVKARNKSGLYGDWHPAGAAAGVVGTELVGTLTVMTVSGLKSTPGVGHNALQWTIADPNANGLGPLALDQVEVWASSTNDRASATKVAEGRTSALHVAVVEGSTYYYWIKPRHRSGAYGDWYPSGATAGVIGTVGFAAGAAHALINGKITATVAANAVTIRVKTLSGDDPSATNPVFVGFRSTDGSYVVRSITAALSLTISSGSTMGVVSASRCLRLWTVAFDDAGTVRLAAINVSFDGAVLPLSEVGTASATAEGGAGGADTVGVFYAPVAIASKQFRIVGHLDWSTPITTPGEYASAPDLIHLAAPATKLPGDIVQPRVSGGSLHTSGVANIPYDDTEPLVSEGALVCTASLTPTSPCNSVLIDAVAYAARSNAGPITAAVIEASGLDGTRAGVGNAAAADQIVTVGVKASHFLNSASARSYQLRVGADGGATLYANGISTGRKLGGSMISFLSATEIVG